MAADTPSPTDDDGPVCADCHRRHDTVWGAIACDERVDARARRHARRRYRLAGLAHHAAGDDQP
jgi:hypothetical protein